MFKSVLALFFPKVCVGCQSFLLANEKVICTLCRHEMPLTKHHLNPKNEAFMKFYGRVPVEFVATLLYYHKRGIVQEIIHSLKYRGQEEVGTIIGEWFAEELKSIPKGFVFDAIIPVPLHKKRLRERGYNQVTTFGLGLSKNLNVPYNSCVLQRKIYSKTQVKKSFLGRTDVSDALFDVTFTEKDHHKHYLLIDDVLTTGSTLEACCRALLKIPGARISIVCMAMSHS